VKILVICILLAYSSRLKPYSAPVLTIESFPARTSELDSSSEQLTQELQSRLESPLNHVEHDL
jgi:hypothetical protein